MLTNQKINIRYHSTVLFFSFCLSTIFEHSASQVCDGINKFSSLCCGALFHYKELEQRFYFHNLDDNISCKKRSNLIYKSYAMYVYSQ